jgi:hypothetical protein
MSTMLGASVVNTLDERVIGFKKALLGIPIKVSSLSHVEGEMACTHYLCV